VSRVSGTNEVSDGNETNNPGQVTDRAMTDETQHHHDPHLEIVKGQPTDEELAALMAVLGGLAGSTPEPEHPERTRWGLPVDRLRYAMSNYQRVTLQQRLHMRH
jgi:Acyl-CoA carboxylase epsilon subunit